MLLPLCLSLAVVTLVVSAASDVRRSGGEVPSTWTQGAPSRANSAFTFTLYLAGSDMPGLSTKMDKIAADNGNSRWLSETELAKYVTPSAAASKAVSDFLSAAGVPTSSISYNKFKDQITVKSTIGQVNKLFSASMVDYSAIGVSTSRTRTYTIPAKISAYVNDVSPIALFGSIETSGTVKRDLDVTSIKNHVSKRHTSVHQARAADVAKVPASCSTKSVTPQCRKDYYGTAAYKRAKGSATQADVAVVGLNNQMVDDEILNPFYKKYAPEAVGSKMPITAFNGAMQQGFSTFEGLLNTETVVAEIFPMTTTFLSMSPATSREDPWLVTFNTLLEKYTAANRPKVVTISYSADEKYFSPSQGKIMCEAAQKVSALGTTILVSSGDWGVAGNGNEKCQPFVVRYPSGCPYVLSVGALEGFASAEQPMEPEQGGLGAFSSGAGASNIFPIPSYQTAKVKAYQKTIGGSLSGSYNTSGRMYPDLAAQGSAYSIIWRGKDTVASGTSGSTPYIASLIALINGKRTAAKKALVGWANPALYKASLKDITTGGVYGCSTTKLGFPAKPGFDAATGNGAPTLDTLSKAYGV